MLISFVVVSICELIVAFEYKKLKNIEELEKEKLDLFKQINEAIDESVKSLQKANDSDTLIGVKYMKDLKEHMKRVDETSMNLNDTTIDESHNRRNFKQIFDVSKFHHKKTSPKDIFDYETIIKPRKVSASEWREILENRQKMQKQLQDWIHEREKEKNRIKQYKLKKKNFLLSGAIEKCPRFGYKGKNRKEVAKREKIFCKDKISDSNFEEDRTNCTKEKKDNKSDDKTKKTRPSSKKKYPCCRKCCKRSYLGCL